MHLDELTAALPCNSFEQKLWFPFYDRTITFVKSNCFLCDAIIQSVTVVEALISNESYLVYILLTTVHAVNSQKWNQGPYEL